MGDKVTHYYGALMRGEGRDASARAAEDMAFKKEEASIVLAQKERREAVRPRIERLKSYFGVATVSELNSALKKAILAGKGLVCESEGKFFFVYSVDEVGSVKLAISNEQFCSTKESGKTQMEPRFHGDGGRRRGKAQGRKYSIKLGIFDFVDRLPPLVKEKEE